MNIFIRATGFLVFCAGYASFGYAQGSIHLKYPDDFSSPGKEWVTAATISEDFFKPGPVNVSKGEVLLVNLAKKNGTDLVTKQEPGDVEINLDFILASNSVSALYLEGRYGVKLADSRGSRSPSINDMGAIDPSTDNAGKNYEGTVPLANAAKASGLWQHIRIIFRAPKFKNGVKVKNARFNEIYINGTLVQVQNEVTGPTASAIFKDEKAAGPLVIKGDGGITAFRNITLLPLKPEPELAGPQNPLSKPRRSIPNPIILNAVGKPYLLRSFLMFGNKKRTHVISVGSPNQLNYSYDLKQGALLQVWRGQFMDVTEMWNDRGEPQLAKPLGSVIPLSAMPALAILADKTNAWPDSVAFDDLQNKGYTLDKSRMPTFEYAWNGIDVTDKISTENNGGALQRTITVSKATDALYCRIATATTIEALKNGLYIIGDKEYYIKIDDGQKAIIRSAHNGQELLVLMGTTPLTYSLIW